VCIAGTCVAIDAVLREVGAQVRARTATQLSDEERARVADVLLDNDGGIERLAPQVERLWNDLANRAEAVP